MKKGIVKKILLSVVIVLVVLVVAVVVIFNLYGDKLIKTGVEKGGQAALKVDVRLEDISAKLLRGTVDLKNLEIDNPEGYSHATFMKLGKGYIALDSGSLFSDTIYIDKLHLSEIEIVLEQKIGKNNIDDLLKNLPQSDSTEKPESTEEKPQKHLVIKELIISDFDVKANIIPGTGKMSTVTIPMKEIRMENIGTKEKINMPQLTSKILSAIAAGIVENGADLLPVDMVKGLGNELTKQGVEVLKAGGEIIKGAGKAGSDVIEGVGGALQGILGGGKKDEEKQE